MTTAIVLKSLTVDEYLAAEHDANIRHEYLNGELVAMAGGSCAHNLLVSRSGRLLGNHLEGTPCRVYQADMKVRIDTANRFYYPDVMVCCNPVAEEPDEYYETSPCLIIEVLSPRTAANDDGEKRINYQTLGSLQEYLLLDPTGHTAVLYRRTGDVWMRYELRIRDNLELASIDYRIGLEQLFSEDQHMMTTSDFGTKPDEFESLSQAIAAANYLEQLLAAEHQWMTNRLSWLFVSQSFCITAFVIVVTTTASWFPNGYHINLLRTINVLRIGLPVLGVVCCVAVGLAVWVSSAVAVGLANERVRLTRYVNAHSPAMIPLIGVSRGMRDMRWTLWFGKLPQYLPWVLAAFWVALLFWVVLLVAASG